MLRTDEAFQKLGVSHFHEHFNQMKQTPLFDNLDTGKITEQEFRTELNYQLGTQFSDKEIDDAWNAMLGGIPEEKMKLLQEVNHSFRSFLLSNTNIIHLKQITRYLVRTYGRANIDALFDKVYYSFTLDLRKPDPAIFIKVIEDNDLKPSQTLFIDDHAPNVEAAKSVGLQAALYTPSENLRTFLEKHLSVKIGAETGS